MVKQDLRFATKPRIVFFDVHDTLIYINKTPPEIFSELCREAGVAVELGAVEKLYPGPRELEGRREAFGNDDEFWLSFNSDLLQKLELADSNNRLARIVVDGFKSERWWSPYSDSAPALTKLKRAGYRLGVIANARHLVKGRLNSTGLRHFFDSVTYSEEVGAAKPDLKIFQKALIRMGCQPQEAVHVGDRLKEDVAGAKAAGLRPILLDRKNEHPDADCLRVQSLHQILQHL